MCQWHHTCVNDCFGQRSVYILVNGRWPSKIIHSVFQAVSANLVEQTTTTTYGRNTCGQSTSTLKTELSHSLITILLYCELWNGKSTSTAISIFYIIQTKCEEDLRQPSCTIHELCRHYKYDKLSWLHKTYCTTSSTYKPLIQPHKMDTVKFNETRHSDTNNNSNNKSWSLYDCVQRTQMFVTEPDCPGAGKRPCFAASLVQ